MIYFAFPLTTDDVLSFHVLIGQLCIFFDEESVQIFSPKPHTPFFYKIVKRLPSIWGD